MASHALRGTVLILEPDAVTRDLIARALIKAGATVREAGTRVDAIAAIEQTPQPDLFLTALHQPDEDVDGAALVRSLKHSAKTRGLPALMIAPRSSPDDVLACLDAGCDDVIGKPFFVPELVARVRAHLRSRRVFDALSRERRDASMLMEIHRALGGNTDPERCLEELVKIVARVLGVKRATIVLPSRDPRFGYAMASSDVPGMRNLEVDLRRYPEIARVMRTGKPLLVEDTSASSLFANLAPRIEAAQVRSILALPIAIDGEAVATLLLNTRDGRKKFSRREIVLCGVAAQTAGFAIRQARVYLATRGRK